MKILQLGNGGGLNPLLTNSSFLIDLYNDGSSYLLFDCGFNIMQRLIKLETEDNTFHISKIDYIFLSHLHDDHIGNYETLTYWNYFKNNKSMLTLAASERVLKYISNKSNQILETGQLVGTTMFQKQIVHSNSNTLTSKITIFSTPANHGAETSNGLGIIFNPNIYNKDATMLIISGDTKALPTIEKKINTISSSYNINNNNILIFHDYSNWNAPTRNLHACEGDFTIEYSKKFQDKCIKYHTGEIEFNKKWITI